MRRLLLLALLGLSALLGGCGQKGPLTLPPTGSDQASEHSTENSAERPTENSAERPADASDLTPAPDEKKRQSGL